MLRCLVGLAGWLLCACAAQTQTAPDENPLFAALIQEGVALTPELTVPLPAPTLADGADPAAEQAALQAAAGRYSLGQFTRNSIPAPFNLQIESVKDAAGERVGLQVDFWFVAYGSLELLQEEGVLRELAGVAENAEAEQEGEETQADGASSRALTEAELASRGLQTADISGYYDGYTFLQFPLLEKVQVQGVARAVQLRNDRSLVVAAAFDPQFLGDAELPGQWRAIERDNLGNASLGAPQPYAAFGGYAKLTPLSEPAGALLIECHLALGEPKAWFNGTNALRSKLATIVQDNVRSFRRALATARERDVQGD